MEFEPIADNVTLFKLKTHFGIDFPYYLVKHKDGNFLIGCPEELPKELSTKIDEIGGIDFIFISHRDDVGIACKFRERFNAKIIIHQSEEKFVEGCEVDISFEKDQSITNSVEVIHTPGHTPGSSCLLFKDYGLLFTGDQICVNKNGEPFVYLEKHSPKEGQISDKDVTNILNKLKNKNFDKIFSLFGIVLDNAKDRLLKQHNL